MGLSLLQITITIWCRQIAIRKAKKETVKIHVCEDVEKPEYSHASK